MNGFQLPGVFIYGSTQWLKIGRQWRHPCKNWWIWCSYVYYKQICCVQYASMWFSWNSAMFVYVECVPTCQNCKLNLSDCISRYRPEQAFWCHSLLCVLLDKEELVSLLLIHVTHSNVWIIYFKASSESSPRRQEVPLSRVRLQMQMGDSAEVPHDQTHRYRLKTETLIFTVLKVQFVFL